MSDVFILGAGFAKAIAGIMPLTKDLSKELSDYQFAHPIPDQIKRMIEHDFESALAFLSQDKPWVGESENLRHKVIFLNLTSAIRDLFWTKCRDSNVWGINTPRAWLDYLIKHWHDNRSSVISLNYDTLIERAASSDYGASRPRIANSAIYPIRLIPANLPPNKVTQPERSQLDGDLETFKLFKLHGSINWFYSGRADFFGEALYYTPHEGGLDRVFNIDCGRDSDNEDWGRLGGKHPLIIPPTLDKSAYFQHESLRWLWYRAGEAIKKARRVICMGYSLPDSDLTMAQFLRTCAPASPIPFEIVDLTERDTRESRCEHFARIIGKDSFKFQQNYSGENCIPSFIIKELIDDPKEKQYASSGVNWQPEGD